MIHRLSRGYYALTAIPILFSACAFGWGIVHGVNALTSGLKRVVMPGIARIRLDKAGPQIVYYEYESDFENKHFDTGQSLDAMTCRLGDPTKTLVPLRTNGIKANYALPGRNSGYSIFSFSAKQAGEFELSCDYVEPGKQKQVVFAVGPDNSNDLFRVVLSSIFLIFAGIGLAAVVFVVIFRKRNVVKGNSNWLSVPRP